MTLQPRSHLYLYFSIWESEVRSRDSFSKYSLAFPYLLSQDAHTQEQLDNFSDAHSRRWEVQFCLQRPRVPQRDCVRGSNQGHHCQAV